MDTNDVNHPIRKASRGLVSNIERQKQKGGPDYRDWEDNLEDPIAALAFAIVDEVHDRLTK